MLTAETLRLTYLSILWWATSASRRLRIGRVLNYGSNIIAMQRHLVSIDLGKTTFHLVVLGASGKVLEKKFTQRKLLTYTANMQTSLIGLEAYAMPGSR